MLLNNKLSDLNINTFHFNIENSHIVKMFEIHKIHFRFFFTMTASAMEIAHTVTKNYRHEERDRKNCFQCKSD